MLRAAATNQATISPIAAAPTSPSVAIEATTAQKKRRLMDGKAPGVNSWQLCLWA